jgi:hypothetical protein
MESEKMSDELRSLEERKQIQDSIFKAIESFRLYTKEHGMRSLPFQVPIEFDEFNGDFDHSEKAYNKMFTDRLFCEDIEILTAFVIALTERHHLSRYQIVDAIKTNMECNY